MINLISPEQKKSLHAARVNVVLVQYCIMLVSLVALVVVIYGVGFWLVTQEKMAANEKLQSQSEIAATYDAVEKRAESFRGDLKVAKQILGKETSYSSFLITLAKDLPSGAIITNLSIGSSNVKVNPQGLFDVDARVNDYSKVLELKNRLEQSSLFEDVNILNVTRPENLNALSGIEAKYPYEATYKVKLSKLGDSR